MNPDNLEDPIRVILKSIVDITFDLVRSFREEGKKGRSPTVDFVGGRVPPWNLS